MFWQETPVNLTTLHDHNQPPCMGGWATQPASGNQPGNPRWWNKIAGAREEMLRDSIAVSFQSLYVETSFGLTLVSTLGAMWPGRAV